MHRWVGAAASAVRGTLRGVADSYRLGGRTWVAAPAIVLLATVPEFAQHIVEIGLGMFDSRAAAHALSNSPVRWGAGYVKLVGYLAAILLTARFWALGGEVRRAWRIAPRTFARTAGAIVAVVAVGGGSARVADLLPHAPALLLLAIATCLQVGMLTWVIGMLVEDSAMTLRVALTTHLPTALALLVLLFAALLPGYALHWLDHRVALGQPRALVWSVMLFDSLVVGALAATVGSALHVGYRLGPTWRGWGPHAFDP